MCFGTTNNKISPEEANCNDETGSLGRNGSDILNLSPFGPIIAWNLQEPCRSCCNKGNSAEFV
jgi:hypothetical protein